MRSRPTGWVSTAAIPWRGMAHRFSFVLFLVLALGLMTWSRSKPILVDRARAQVVDALAPVFDTVARPMEMIEGAVVRIQNFFLTQSENERLRLENEKLLRWQNAALALENENRELRALLRYKPEPAFAYITARVIADAGGPFARSLVVTAGKVDGVRDGMAAMTGEGVIGRVVEVGSWSSRVLLITDLNSRIPVMITGSGDHAILAGDNSLHPKLLYLASDADLKVGARVMTSGHGGIFPPNLPVGVISHMTRDTVEVTPLAALGRINQVRLVDFSLAGGSFNPIAGQVETNRPSP